MIIRKAQSIFEYVILTAVVVGLILVFTSSTQFEDIQDAFNRAFERSCVKIVSETVE